ncbi:hypothetical protein [Ascidiimonas sp. W6]|uniref:hypothetical protein n=1 Tax=Ascidiimonas meishanensis TaxID=3128903 RepID=UPI0030EBEFD1
MWITIAKYSIILFGMFLIYAGLLMLFAPKKARQVLRKAGSTNLINYAEITIRMLPAIGLILYASLSKFPEVFKIVGWFMLGTSLVLYFVPRKLHHGYALKCAEILKPKYFQYISPLSFLFGSFFIYSVL